MLTRSLLLFLFLTLVCAPAWAQNPAFGHGFPQTAVTRIDVSIDTADLSWLLADSNRYLNDYQPVSFVYTDSGGATHSFAGAGMRLRGNTSRNADKKSFKLHTKVHGGTEDFFDLRKINLKGAHNDPTISRERMSYWLMRQIGAPAQRVAHTELYFNGDYRGLYVHVEQVDKRFTQSRFGNDDGNLYKCTWGASLTPDNDVYDQGVYELETNEQLNDRSDLEALIAALNAPLATRKAELDATLNVDGVLKYLAVEVLTGHWDGASYNKNNYYLYHNTDTDLFEFIMYDPDNTLGIDWVNRDWANRDIYDWGSHGESRPIYWNILAIDEYRDQFTVYVNELLTGEYYPNFIFPRIDNLKAMLQPYVVPDTFYVIDYGFTLQDFEDSFSDDWGGHVDYGMKPFIFDRWESATKQLDTEALSVKEASGSRQWQVRYTHGVPQLAYNGSRPAQNARWEAIDAQGRIVASQELGAAGAGTVPTPKLPPGYYVWRLTTTESTTTIKVVSYR